MSDLITEAMNRCNRGKAHDRLNELYRQHWAYLESHQEEEKLLASIWNPAVKHYRRLFKAQFRAKAWETLWIQWSGRGYVVDYRDRTAKGYLHYVASWKGMKFERELHVTSKEDVLAEAYRLGGVLAAWDGAQ